MGHIAASGINLMSESSRSDVKVITSSGVLAKSIPRLVRTDLGEEGSCLMVTEVDMVLFFNACVLIGGLVESEEVKHHVI